MRGSTGIELLCATVLLLIAGAHFVWRLRAPHRIALTDVAMWMSAGFFGFAPWVVFITSGELPDQPSTIVFEAYVMLVLFMAGLLIAGAVLTKLFPPRDIIPPDVFPSRFWMVTAGGTTANVLVVIVLYGIAIGGRLFVGMRYGMFLSGESFAKDMPPLFGEFLSMSEVLTRGAFVWAVATWLTTRQHRVVALSLIVVDLAMAMTVGRRWILTDIMIFLVVFAAFKGISRRFIIPAILGAIVLSVAVSAFDRIRYYRWAHASSMRTGLGAYVDAIRQAIDDRDSARREALLHGNYSTRPLDVMQFNMLILKCQDASPGQPYMRGSALVGNIVHAIPYIIYSNKRNWLTPEENVKAYYAVPNRDMGSTWVVYGAADFGVLGGLFIGSVLGAVLGLGEMFARWLSPKFPFVGLSIVAVLLAYSCLVQEYPSALLACLRNALMLAGICMVCMPFVGIKWVSSAGAESSDDAGGSWGMDDAFLEGGAITPEYGPPPGMTEVF